MAGRVTAVALAALTLATILGGCAAPPEGEAAVRSVAAAPVAPIVAHDHVALVSRATDTELQVHTTDGWKGGFWAGVNLGTTVPGKQPGEFGPKYNDFARWFEQMREAHIEVIRVYTVLPPAFYEAFADHNDKHPDEPLWVLHGIWAPEDELIADETGRDAWAPDIDAEFRERIAHAVAVVHGDITLPARRGFASGTYDRDISDRLLGWVVGTEWFPFAVKVTNDAHPDMPPFAGAYFRAATDATAFDSWLASMLDHLAEETTDYGDQHPVSFTNWVTTDPLAHPNEALEQEDLVSVDPNHVIPTDDWHAGYFALYHVYPYYPDLLRYEPQYQDHVTPNGTVDPYAGYLRALADAHPGIPIIVGEYGIPSSRGIAHLGPLGRDQGHHNETEQADMIESLHRAIVGEGYAGGLVFEWADEWFKRTWNTQGLEIPQERRALWRNMLTNEEHFGLIAAEPGPGPDDVIRLDARFDDWDRRRARGIHEAPDVEVRVTHDAAYLSLIMRRTAGPWTEIDSPLHVAIDVLPEGVHELDTVPGHTFQTSPETLWSFDIAAQDGRAQIRAPYDPFAWQFGRDYRYMDWDPTWDDPDASTMLPWRLPLNRPLTLPATGEEIPFEFAEIGHLAHGQSHPDNGPPDPLMDWYHEGHVLELRIPWTMLGFTDPSSRSVWDWPYERNAIVARQTDGIQIELVWSDDTGSHSTEPIAYSWDIWNVVPYHERTKVLYDRVRTLYAETD